MQCIYSDECRSYRPHYENTHFHQFISDNNLTYSEVEKMLDEKRLELNKKMISLLNKEWVFRETGSPFVFDDNADLLLNNINMKKADIIKKCKSSKPFSLSLCESFIDFFQNDRSEVYPIELDL